MYINDNPIILSDYTPTHSEWSVTKSKVIHSTHGLSGTFSILVDNKSGGGGKAKEISMNNIGIKLQMGVKLENL